MGQVREPVLLHIRGVIRDVVKNQLMTIAKDCGVESRVRFLELIPPDDLLASASEHDIGLCLEVPSVLNRDICITNKIFLYMLAGLAVISSCTRGHSEVLANSPGAGFLYDSGDVGHLALIIERLARDEAVLKAAQTAALVAARDRWNWERESRALVAAVHNLLKKRPGDASVVRSDRQKRSIASPMPRES